MIYMKMKCNEILYYFIFSCQLFHLRFNVDYHTKIDLFKKLDAVECVRERASEWNTQMENKLRRRRA